MFEKCMGTDGHTEHARLNNKSLEGFVDSSVEVSVSALGSCHLNNERFSINKVVKHIREIADCRAICLLNSFLVDARCKSSS